MPSVLTYPGVYIEEVPSGVRTITGVATSITAFLGRAQRGPVNRTVRVQSFAEFSRIFGGLWQPSRMSYAVNQFFQHGGSDALIVRVFNGDVDGDRATISVTTSGTALELAAASPGVWGDSLRATVDHVTASPSETTLFNLLVEELDANGDPVASETFRNISTVVGHARYAETVINDGSTLVVVTSPSGDGDVPTDGSYTPTGGTASDGDAITDAEILGDRDAREGIYALEEADLFNLLCVPPLDEDTDVAETTWDDVAIYCQERRAMAVIDPRAEWETPVSDAISNARDGVNDLRSAVGNAVAINAMAVFPRLRMPDPLGEGRITAFAPCGAVAGIIARTDAQRGVWKAPAGLAASFSGTQGFTYTMTDLQNGILNQVGLNCLRSFPVAGHLLWGARTLAGADALASEWKYVPVRRLALFLEESLYRGTQWVVFEPNDEPLWAQIRLNIGAFMQNLFRQGAFQGASPREAYFVKCDSETTTQNDIDLGIVNILVGFAPLKPAEFVVLKIQQMAGEIET
jgi:phage tail sheath protein FI